MRGLLRRRQRGGTRENEASRAGLRPDGVYVYAERSQGRANRPFLAGEHRCGEASRAWYPREFGAVLGVSASLPLPAPPLPSPSRRYAPQCFVGGYASSPCDVSRRASDEPRCCMSLSSALAPSSLASPSIRRVFLRSICARRRPVSELNPRQMCRDAIRRYMTLIDPNCFANNFVRTVISFRRA